MAAFGLFVAVLVAIGLRLVDEAARERPAELPPAKVEVVRVLDIVIRDSNTTGRRQRFVCYPNPKKESP